MDHNYYIVTVKCGHVGRHNYIPIDLPIRADSSKQAATIARNRGRVKHDWKDAVIAVEAVDRERFDEVRESNRRDPYMNAHSSTEQRQICTDLDERIVRPEDESVEIDPLERARRIAFLFKKQAVAAWRFIRG